MGDPPLPATTRPLSGLSGLPERFTHDLDDISFAVGLEGPLKGVSTFSFYRALVVCKSWSNWTPSGRSSHSPGTPAPQHRPGLVDVDGTDALRLEAVLQRVEVSRARVS